MLLEQGLLLLFFPDHASSRPEMQDVKTVIKIIISNRCVVLL
jgi:hypothetical protein